MHGLTKPVSLEVESFTCKTNPINHKPTCGVDASAVIRRSDWKLVSDLPLLGDSVTLKLQIEAAKR
jgi:polyisoprenoid-binding protein YceI